MSEDPDGEVLDMGGPLCCKLEKLDIVPLDAIDGYCAAGNTIKLHPSAITFTFRGMQRTS